MQNYEAEERASEIANPSSKLIDNVCPSCEFYPTKAGNETPDVALPMQTALWLEELSEIGVQFTLTDVMNGSLSPKMIAALKGLKRGRDKAESAKQEADMEQIRNQQNRPPQR